MPRRGLAASTCREVRQSDNITARGGHLHLVQFFTDKGADEWDEALYYAALSGHLNLMQHLIEQEGATKWPNACITLLKQHPDIIVTLFQRGKVPRERFEQHAAAFEQQIKDFLTWQQQVSRYLYGACLLPPELCALIVAY